MAVAAEGGALRCPSVAVVRGQALEESVGGDLSDDWKKTDISRFPVESYDGHHRSGGRVMGRERSQKGGCNDTSSL